MLFRGDDKGRHLFTLSTDVIIFKYVQSPLVESTDAGPVDVEE